MDEQPERAAARPGTLMRADSPPQAASAALTVQVPQTGDHYACNAGESLLKGMLRLGRKGIPAGCVNGGCGVCKVRVLDGRVQPIGPISRAHVSLDEEALGYTLACRATPLSAVRLEVSARLRKPFSAPAAAAASALRTDFNKEN